MIPDSEAKRRLELVIAQELSELVPGATILPEKGGDAVGDGTVIVPPYAVVGVREFARDLPQEDTFSGEFTVTVVSHADDSSSPAHAALVKLVHDGLAQITHGYSEAHRLMLHGAEIVGGGTAEDDERQGYGDVVRVSVGWSLRQKCPRE